MLATSSDDKVQIKKTTIIFCLISSTPIWLALSQANNHHIYILKRSNPTNEKESVQLISIFSTFWLRNIKSIPITYGLLGSEIDMAYFRKVAANDEVRTAF